MRRLLPLLALLLLVGCVRDVPPAASPQVPTSDATAGPALRLELVADGFTQPLFLTHDGVSGEVFVVEQGGIVWRLKGGTREVWRDFSAATDPAGEQGFLGLAFDPRDDRAYASYTDRSGDTHVERVQPDGVRERILFIDQPYANHNGGHLAFGPDGFLYFGTGDGGSRGDPQGNGQNPNSLLGGMLRLDVSGDSGYLVPPDNAWGEVWAKGLRNPWRFSFDRGTGDLYIGDVGQNKWEEVDHLPAGTASGTNFGWNIYEGTHRYSLLGETFSEHTPPVAEYANGGGNCAVTGGYVSRGTQSPGLDGVYLFGDYCSGKIWGMREKEGTWRVFELLDTELNISSFGEDSEGEVYVVHHGGAILRIVGGAPMPDALRLGR